METRLIIAYAIIATMVLLALAGAAYARHNTRPRKLARKRRREAQRRYPANM